MFVCFKQTFFLEKALFVIFKMLVSGQPHSEWEGTNARTRNSGGQAHGGCGLNSIERRAHPITYLGPLGFGQGQKEGLEGRTRTRGHPASDFITVLRCQQTRLSLQLSNFLLHFFLSSYFI